MFGFDMVQDMISFWYNHLMLDHHKFPQFLSVYEFDHWCHLDNRANKSDGGLISLERDDADTKCDDGAAFSRRHNRGAASMSEDCGTFAKDLPSKVLERMKSSDPEKLGRIWR